MSNREGLRDVHTTFKRVSPDYSSISGANDKVPYGSHLTIPVLKPHTELDDDPFCRSLCLHWLLSTSGGMMFSLQRFRSGNKANISSMQLNALATVYCALPVWPALFEQQAS